MQYLLSLPQCNVQMYIICAEHVFKISKNAEVALGYLSIGRKSYPECIELVIEQFNIVTKSICDNIEDEDFAKPIAMKYDEFTKYFNNNLNYDIGLLNVLSKFPMDDLSIHIVRYS